MHETTTKRPGRAGKYIRRALLALAAVILAAVLVLLALFQAELRTLNTIERVDDTDLFTMTYLGDYGLDDFLAQGGRRCADRTRAFQHPAGGAGAGRL